MVLCACPKVTVHVLACTKDCNMYGCYHYKCVQVIGTFCMDLAIKKAKEVGIGWVTCTGELYITLVMLGHEFDDQTFHSSPCRFQSLRYCGLLLHESYGEGIYCKS